jgi:FkbM family methyltransferase
MCFQVAKKRIRGLRLSDRLLFKLFGVERSYSQCGEDKILDHLFRAFDKSKIRYLDIGTNDPIVINNTYLFYRDGAVGVCVEPNPVLYKKIKEKRPRDTCLNLGIGEQDGEAADFYLMSSHTLNTFSKEEAQDLHKGGVYTIVGVIQVPLRSINSIVEEHFDIAPDLVSIDVEGWNEKIVRTFDFNRCRPFCFCVETLTFSDCFTGQRLTGIFEFFEANNYSLYADTHINSIFIDNKALPDNKLLPDRKDYSHGLIISDTRSEESMIAK